MTQPEPECRRRCLMPADQTSGAGLTVHEECARQADVARVALPELYAHLWTLLPPAQGGAGAPVTGSKEKPVGIRVDVHDHLVRIHDTLSGWVDQVIEDHPDQLWFVGSTVQRPLKRLRLIAVGAAGVARVVDRPDRDRYATRVDAMVAWLGARGPWMYRQVWSVDYVEEIRDLEHDARRLGLLYDEEPDLKMGVPCSRCGRFTLIRDQGDTDVRCARLDACGKVYRPSEYQAWVEEYAADPAALEVSQQVEHRRTAAAQLTQDRRYRRRANLLLVEATRMEEAVRTPHTPSGLKQLDELEPAHAVLHAWVTPGPSPEWHDRAKASVRATMPLLARALDRLQAEGIVSEP